MCCSLKGRPCYCYLSPSEAEENKSGASAPLHLPSLSSASLTLSVTLPAPHPPGSPSDVNRLTISTGSALPSQPCLSYPVVPGPPLFFNSTTLISLPRYPAQTSGTLRACTVCISNKFMLGEMSTTPVRNLESIMVLNVQRGRSKLSRTVGGGLRT